MPDRENARVSAIVLRARRAASELAYLTVALPLSIGGFLFVVVGTALGVVLAVTFIGLPLLAVTGLAARRLGGLDRWLVGVLLDEHVPPPRPLQRGPGVLGWLQATLRDPASWRARAYLLLKLPLAVVSFYLSAVCWVVGLFWFTYPIWWRTSGPGPLQDNVLLDAGALIFRGSAPSSAPVAHRVTIHAGSVHVDTWPLAVLVCVAGAALLLAAPWVVHALSWLHARLVRALLGPATNAERIRELESARTRIVDDSAVRLRRIERDLHDGTQAQLATLAMTLGQAKEKLEHRPNVPFDPDGALELIESAHRHAGEALLELRGITRGIHPPALDLGLDAALATLVAHSAVPARLHAELSSRPSGAIETIAYFSVAELLANAAKHSRATRVTVEVRESAESLYLRVSDDGIGGAGRGNGSGLPGLADRVRSVDGDLRLSSPRGGPTVIDVELPLHL
jgi:signal transduction histidine kinase